MKFSTKEQIENCENTIEQLSDELKFNRVKLKNLQIQQAKEKFGVEVGSIVIKGGKEYRVVEVEPCSTGRPYLYGNPKKKDGTFGKARRFIWQWEPKKD